MAMLRFPRLKTIFIIAACVLGAVLAGPNVLAPHTLPPWVPQPRVNLGQAESANRSVHGRGRLRRHRLAAQLV